MFKYDVFLVCHSLGKSVTGIKPYYIIFWLIPQEYNFTQIIYFFKQNILMLNMLTFDEFSVCHLLGNSVTGIALFIFRLIPIDKY